MTLTRQEVSPETLEESFPFFDYIWKDRNNLSFLGIGAFLLVFKTIYFGGVYDTWPPREGDVRKLPTWPLTQTLYLVIY